MGRGGGCEVVRGEGDVVSEKNGEDLMMYTVPLGTMGMDGTTGMTAPSCAVGSI